MAKSVLLEFRGSKRRIFYEEDDDLIDLCEVELKKVAQNENVRLITDIQGYSKSGPPTKDHSCYSVSYSTEWREFVDVIHAIEIDDKDHLKVVPLPGPSPQTLLKFAVSFCNSAKIMHLSTTYPHTGMEISGTCSRGYVKI